MAIKIKKGDAMASLNMTPIIDIVFNLLIFFLVASKFEESERALEVVLPQASEAKALTETPKELFINIDRTGKFVVENSVISDDQLLKKLQQAWANNPGRQTVIIRADKRCPFDYVATSMNLCNKANIRDYRVTTAAPGE